MFDFEIGFARVIANIGFGVDMIASCCGAMIIFCSLLALVRFIEWEMELVFLVLLTVLRQAILYV